MTASHVREFMEYMELIFSLQPNSFTVKIPRGSTAGSRSRYYELNNENEVRQIIREEPNFEYIKFSRNDDFYGTIYVEDKYFKISFDSPEFTPRFWNVLHTQNLGTFEIAVRMTSRYWYRLREMNRPVHS